MKVIVSQEIEQVCPEFVGACVDAMVVNSPYSEALWKEIDDLYQSCDSAFKKQAFAAFSNFLAPIYEKSPLRNEDGSIKELDEVLAGEEIDISEFDR
jgi:hypothetical protein